MSYKINCWTVASFFSRSVLLTALTVYVVLIGHNRSIIIKCQSQETEDNRSIHRLSAMQRLIHLSDAKTDLIKVHHNHIFLIEIEAVPPCCFYNAIKISPLWFSGSINQFVFSSRNVNRKLPLFFTWQENRAACMKASQSKKQPFGFLIISIWGAEKFDCSQQFLPEPDSTVQRNFYNYCRLFL